MANPERLRDASRFYWRVGALARDRDTREYCADCALDLAQMADQVERELIAAAVLPEIAPV